MPINKSPRRKPRTSKDFIKKSTRPTSSTNQPSSLAIPPELVFGLVGAIGANTEKVADELSKALKDVGYNSKNIHVIELLNEVSTDFPSQRDLEKLSKDEAYHSLMDHGTEFRGTTNR